MMLPQTNARVSAITGSGAPRQYGRAPEAGGAKWSGDEPAYVMDKVRSTINTSNAALVRVKDTTVIIPPDLTTVEAGDHVTYTFHGVTVTREVADVTQPQPPAGSFSVHTYMRLHLVPANA